MSFYYPWKSYVPVAQRRAKALREMQKLCKKGVKIEPVEITGRKITRTFWGEVWCDHLEKFSDFANRLPRGRTYVRNGSVCHLAIEKGRIRAIVSGSELYNVDVVIKSLSANKWRKVRSQCAGQIGSMLELLQGRLSNQVMQIVSDRDNGLFPKPSEIKFSCNCPDWAGMCKHIAAVLYGIGARLDQQPDLLFLLRNVNHEDLITTEMDVRAATSRTGKRRRLAGKDLSDVFGVEIEQTPAPKPKRKTTKKKAPKKKRIVKTKKKGVAHTGKKVASHRRKKTVTTANKKAFIPSSAAVARLRNRFGMTQSQFAKLVGASQPTIANWENAGGKLNLRQRTRKALTRATELTADQAARKLKRR